LIQCLRIPATTETGFPRRVSIKMNKFSVAQVNDAIARLSRQSNTAIEQVLVNARRLEIEPLVQACQDELRMRGSLNLSAAEAERTSKISARIAGRALSEVIEIAFTEVPAKPEERLILNWISRHPGTSQAEIGTVYKNGDLSLVIGHLIYYRFGYFRPMLSGPTQSDLLLDRDRSSGRVCYTLRPEARAAFSALNLLGQAA
jgi:hypothetical protein